MADVIKDEEFGEPLAAADPFNGDCQQFTWAREVSVGQLQDEVTAVLGDVRLAAVVPVSDEGVPVPVSAQDPVVFYVTPSSADVAAVRQVLAAHKPDPYYGMSQEEREQAQLREKIASGEELSSSEVQQALRMLVG